MKKLTKSFWGLIFGMNFSVLLICIFLAFTGCGSDGSDGNDSGRPEKITITIPGSSVELTMNWIPAGTFQMGDTDIATPVHEVTLTKGFYMGKFEVTQEQYMAVMEPATNPSYFHGGSGREPASGEEQGKRPVDTVSWHGAIAFCNRLSILQGLEPVYVIAGISNTDADAWLHSAVPRSYNVTWDAAEMIGWPDNVPNGYRLPTEA